MLSREAILGHKDSKIGSVYVEEFGGDVCVAMFTAAEADRFTKELGNAEMPTNVFVTLLGACDKKGERLFSDEDVTALAALPSRALTTIANKVLEHNGLVEKSVEEAKNGSSETADDGSDSGSPSPSDEPSKN